MAHAKRAPVHAERLKLLQDRFKKTGKPPTKEHIHKLFEGDKHHKLIDEIVERPGGEGMLTYVLLSPKPFEVLKALHTHLPKSGHSILNEPASQFVVERLRKDIRVNKTYRPDQLAKELYVYRYDKPQTVEKKDGRSMNRRIVSPTKRKGPQRKNL